MTSPTLSREIQDLYLELLLANNLKEDSFSAALVKLAAVLESAQSGGNALIADTTSRLIKLVDAARASTAPQEDVPLLLEGLKNLESELATGVQPSFDNPAFHPSPSSSNTLAEDPELLGDFVLEAREHLSVVETQLLGLEQNPDDTESTHACFRAIHTIKGIAGFLDLHAIREVSHEAETLLDSLRNGLLKVNGSLIDVLLRSSDFLRQEVAAVEALLAGKPREPQADYQPLLQTLRLSKAQNSDQKAFGRQPESAVPPLIPVAAKALEEDSPAPIAAEPPSEIPFNPAPSTFAAFTAVRSEAPVAASTVGSSPSPAAKRVADTKQAVVSRSVKVDMEKLDYLADIVGELVVTQSLLRPESTASDSDSPMARNFAQLARITAEVQKTAMGMRMVPIGQTFQRLSRLVRDVSRQVGKNIELEVSGEEIELDRSMVEELADPLMHMVRNSIDHGVEDSEQRRQSGKNPVGRIFLQARHDAGQVQIEISDDGHGLNRDRILAKARDKGLVDAAATLTDSEIYNLIFEPGFSTAEKVSDLSGRGVGMDVVRKQIQKLRGRVELKSTPGQGTTFLLRLPLTLAIIDGLVVSLFNTRYIIPIPTVREILHPTAKILFTVQGRSEMVMVRNRMLPKIRLSQWLKVQRAESAESGPGVLIVLDAQSKTFCLAVDKVLGKQEVVIKSLGELLQDVPGVADGAILGDGRVGSDSGRRCSRRTLRQCLA